MEPINPNCVDETLAADPAEAEGDDADLLVEFDGGPAAAARRTPESWGIVTRALIASVVFHAAVIGILGLWVSLQLMRPQFARIKGTGSSTDPSAVPLRGESVPMNARQIAAMLSKPPDPANSMQSLSSDAASFADAAHPIRLDQRDKSDSTPIIGVGAASIATPRFHRSTPGPTTPQHAQSAVPAATAPRVAQSGRRGNDDQFDQRGLPLPEYPAESRRRGEEGIVELDVEVLPDGSVGRIEVVSDPGYHRLVDSAIQAMRRVIKFIPATLAGVPVTGHLVIPFKFVLK